MSELDLAEAAATAPAARNRHQGLALLLVALTQLMIVLDATIVTVALPDVQRSLGLSNAGLQWVVTSYTLVSGGLLLLGGRLGDLFGRRDALVAGLVLFAGASLVGGLATTGAVLIGARVAQGVGSAVMAPATLALIVENFPEGPARNRAMSVWAATSAFGGAVGLVAGGLLTEYASWRWTLFVNVPVGVLVAVTAPLVLVRSARRRARLDLAGGTCATLGVAGVIYALSSAAPAGAGDAAHWGSAKVLVALVAGVVLLVAFAVTERWVASPLLPPRLLADRDRAAAFLLAGCIGVAFFGVLFFLTLFLQQVLGQSPVQAGFGFLPWVATFAVSASVAGRLLPRVGPRPLLLGGAAVGALGLLWLSRVSADATYTGHVLGPLVVTPLGVGLMAVPLAALALRGVDAGEAGIASSLLNVGQQLGASVGVAGLGTLVWSLVAHRGGDPDALAHAFGVGFLVTAAALGAAFLVALVLPRRG